MYVALGKLQVKSGDPGEVVKLLASMDEHVKKVDGLVASQILRPEDDKKSLWLLSMWRDKAAVEAHHAELQKQKDSVPQLAQLRELVEPDHEKRGFVQVHLVHGPCAPEFK